MNLRGIANRVASGINPNVSVTILRSTGYALSPGHKQLPTYADPVTGLAQLQAMTSDDLRQTEGLNIQGVLKAIYLRGELRGVVRPHGVGGDLILVGGDTWLVVHILENWPTWTKAVLCLQSPAPT